MSLQVLEGIHELHSVGYIHRGLSFSLYYTFILNIILDLKPANIVINAELTKAYIIDFGMSCRYITDPAKMPEYVFNF